ncbi:MAG: iron-sulfur cluster assembly scaffold protein [Candidatus Andeanibacterium colombiense]|uniref:Iron-sulfur cluster assembly scaffold protein n=1 Tax=Candidatus Andeanibacterium colombiense TaxID=3121345 RepID=A0AAJ6BPD2_9SPHN|nr:MAG: iron-sulfur cluster assembly scaffold protein [Sphingomonadaceae bacterium]
MASAEKLYTPELLALTLRLADYPWREDFSHTGEARSKSCGSTLAMGLDLDGDGNIARIGLKARACAVGQASIAIFADAAGGHDRAAIASARDAMIAWLAGSGPLPDWPGIAALEPAQSYPARHGAIMLPWEAALAALSQVPATG